jgi:hypothetical protein
LTAATSLAQLECEEPCSGRTQGSACHYALDATRLAVKRPRIKYVWNGDVAVAYQVFAEDPKDLPYLGGKHRGRLGVDRMLHSW